MKVRVESSELKDAAPRRGIFAFCRAGSPDPAVADERSSRRGRETPPYINSRNEGRRNALAAGVRPFDRLRLFKAPRLQGCVAFVAAVLVSGASLRAATPG